MKIGIGMPNSLREANGASLVEFARRADAAGFSSLATIDRIAFPSYESLIALAAAAAVTERIKLFPNVLLGPTRNPVILAKEAGSVDRLSNGRLVLGVGVGTLQEEFALLGAPFADRGARADDAMRATSSMPAVSSHWACARGSRVRTGVTIPSFTAHPALVHKPAS